MHGPNGLPHLAAHPAVAEPRNEPVHGRVTIQHRRAAGQTVRASEQRLRESLATSKSVHVSYSSNVFNILLTCTS